ncbi:MAG: RtcB family protein [Polyangiales bacterium]
MSFLARVERAGASHYVLPRVGGMLTEVHAFLSESLFAQTDEALWSQAAASASVPGATGMYLMPDTHLGYHLPVGGVLVTEDTILQAGSGYDISCGCIYLEVPGLHAGDIVDPAKRKRWIEAVERRVATGVGSDRPRLMPSFSSREVEDVLRHGAKAVGVSAELCERQYIPVPDEVDLYAIPRAREKAGPQMGSVGGGNHFVEMQVDRDDGSVWVMIHCGSRGFGWQAANYFFYEGARLRGLPPNRREQSWLRADEDLGKLYWAWHNAAANFAVANRWTIVEGIQQALNEVYGARAKPYYEISHNLVQEETLVLPDGTTKRGFVHRKGATRAFPAGHPDLKGTRWEKTGHPCLIPGSMLDGAAILFPLEGAYRSGCSVNHGSGRVMPRGEAKRELAALHDDIDREMQTITRTLGGVEVTGVVGNTERTPLDECGHVYKSLDAVLDVLVDEGIARIERRLYPVANIKGTD